MYTLSIQLQLHSIISLHICPSPSPWTKPLKDKDRSLLSVSPVSRMRPAWSRYQTLLKKEAEGSLPSESFSFTDWPTSCRATVKYHTCCLQRDPRIVHIRPHFPGLSNSGFRCEGGGLHQWPGEGNKEEIIICFKLGKPSACGLRKITQLLSGVSGRCSCSVCS